VTQYLINKGNKANKGIGAKCELESFVTDPFLRLICIGFGFKEMNQGVRDTIPEVRLFVFNVADGWNPLCRFLELAVPDTPFPHRHPKKEFWEHFDGEPA
jgi:hypothetical protein